jgi:hypothetical protein
MAWSDVTCSIAIAHTRPEQARCVERVTGIEPAFSAWEADVLPLNYTRVPNDPVVRGRAS